MIQYLIFFRGKIAAARGLQFDKNEKRMLPDEEMILSFLDMETGLMTPEAFSFGSDSVRSRSFSKKRFLKEGQTDERNEKSSEVRSSILDQMPLTLPGQN